MTIRAARLVNVILASVLSLSAGVPPGGSQAAAAAPPPPPPPEAVEAFRAECLAKADKAEQGAPTMVVPGRDGWLFLRSELRHVGVGKFWGPEAELVTRANKA